MWGLHIVSKSGDLIIHKCNDWCLLDICSYNMKCQHSEKRDCVFVQQDSPIGMNHT